MFDNKNSIVVISVGLFAVALLYIFRFDIPYDREANADLRNQLDDIGKQQQQTVEDLGRAREGIGAAERVIDESIETADAITDGLSRMQVKSNDGREILTDSANRIEQCIRILQEAKGQRGKD